MRGKWHRTFAHLDSDQLDVYAECLDQDDQLDIIGKGVANLKNFSMAVKDETDLHIRLLDDMDGDVLHAKDGLNTEGARAAKVKYYSSPFVEKSLMYSIDCAPEWKHQTLRDHCRITYYSHSFTHTWKWLTIIGSKQRDISLFDISISLIDECGLEAISWVLSI